MTSSLSQKLETQKGKQPKSLAAQQLHLFGFCQSAALSADSQALIIKPKDRSHHGRDGYFFQAWCGYTGRFYGGLYSRAELDRILEIFEPIPGEYAGDRFGAACNQVFQENRNLQVNRGVES